MANEFPTCAFCGGKMVWQSDFNYDEWWGEGEGVVSVWTCTECGAEGVFSIREDEDD